MSDRGCTGERNSPRERNRRPVAEERSWGAADASRGIIPERGAKRRRTRQDAEQDYGAAAERAVLGLAGWNGIPDLFGDRFRQVEQSTAEREPVGAVT